MPNFVTLATEKALGFWRQISLTQRIFVAGLALLVIGGFFGFIFWINQPNYKILYSNLGVEDANRVVKMLQAEKVAYRLEDDGKTVLVPAPKLYDLRIKVAGEAGLVGTGIGFEIFDEVKVGQTDFVQKINYQRALQGELSRTISEFPNVESARVHLVVPQRSLFIEEQQKPSASVVLKLKDLARKMDPKEVQGIVNMMVMAVEGLDKNRVSITDSMGKPLFFPDEDSIAGLSVTQREHKNRVEVGFERRIDELLSPVLGPGKVIAKVNADLDFSQRTIRKEIFDSENPVVRSEQRSEETNRGRANLESGSPDPNFRGDGLNGALSTQEGSRETRTTNYEINKEEHSIIGQVGEVSRLSVAVVVDGIYEKNAEGVFAFVPRPKEELDRIRLLVSNAVGFDRARGDTVEVLCIPFGETELPQEPNVAELVAQYAERLGKPLINALLAFLFLMLVVRPVILALIRPKVEAGEVIEGLEGLPSAEEQLALYEAQEEAARVAVEEANRAAAEADQLDEEEDEFGMLQRLEDIKAHALQLAEHNMEQSITVLRGWMKNESKATIRP
ncbi:MAG: flagellar basal-body MS-ring/collar protein FliF [Bilophila sp.]